MRRGVSGKPGSRAAAAVGRCGALSAPACSPRLGDEQRRLAGLGLDLLAQAVDVGLERVGRHAGVVAPDLVQQDLARHRLVADAVEVLQDRGLLLGQVDAAAVLAHQHLGGRLEAVGADRQHDVVAELELAQLGAQAGHQHAEAEGLGDVVVGAGVEALDRVGLLAERGQHDDRRLEALAAQAAADLAAVDVRQADVEQDGGERLLRRHRERLLARAGLVDREALVLAELGGQLAAQRRVVVHDQERSPRRHRPHPSRACHGGRARRTGLIWGAAPRSGQAAAQQSGGECAPGLPGGLRSAARHTTRRLNGSRPPPDVPPVARRTPRLPASRRLLPG